MATIKYDSFKDLRKGKYDWKVCARVMNLWRGYTKTGEPFTSFNILLLDQKRSRVHAFVPTSIAALLEKAIEQGKIYLFKNFTVKEYKQEDRFRCINRPIQIIFGNDTKVLQLDEKDHIIDQVVFDFYDLGDLKDLAKQSTYLTDVIGVVQERELDLIDIKNKHGSSQMQLRFHITDGRKIVKITFWDAFAEMFHDIVKTYQFELPLIIIIGSGGVTEWQGHIDISNVAATHFYINYEHHSVTHYRKMLQKPEFAQLLKSFRKDTPTKICTIQELHQLGEDAIESDVLCKLKVVEVQVGKWYRNICTSCYNELQADATFFKCISCPRFVPYPLKWFQLAIKASDSTGVADLILDNVAGCKSFQQTIHDIEEQDDQAFPEILKTIENKDYTIRLLISKENVRHSSKVYISRDLIVGHSLAKSTTEIEITQPKPLQESYAEPSCSTYHLESISENN